MDARKSKESWCCSSRTDDEDDVVGWMVGWMVGNCEGISLLTLTQSVQIVCEQIKPTLQWFVSLTQLFARQQMNNERSRRRSRSRTSRRRTNRTRPRMKLIIMLMLLMMMIVMMLMSQSMSMSISISISMSMPEMRTKKKTKTRTFCTDRQAADVPGLVLFSSHPRDSSLMLSFVLVIILSLLPLSSSTRCVCVCVCPGPRETCKIRASRSLAPSADVRNLKDSRTWCSSMLDKCQSERHTRSYTSKHTHTHTHSLTSSCIWKAEHWFCC